MHPTAEKLRQRLHEQGLDIEVRELPEATRTAVQAATALGCDVAQIVRSLVIMVGGDPIVCLCAGDRQVDLARLGADARMATAAEVREVTGFAVGGVPPLGYDRVLRTVVDGSLRRFETVWCAAGTPHAVFPIETGRLLRSLSDAEIVEGVGVESADRNRRG